MNNHIDIRFKCNKCDYKTLYDGGAYEHTKNNPGHIMTDAPQIVDND